jgi:ribonucleoside-diphosphate reductase beta chain
MITNIRKGRTAYRPFQYPNVYDLGIKQRNAFWLETNIPMAKDVNDWKQRLTPEEKNLVGNVLKGFTQMEVLVGDYWRKVAEWFPHPEIALAATTMSFFETIHQTAYDLLNSTLDLNDYEGFIQEPEIKEKIEMLMDVKNEDDYEILSSLAIFSAFVEGVSIFSSFAILLSFQSRDLLNGVGKIIAYSVRDESHHSKTGIELYRIFKKELEEKDSDFEEQFVFTKNTIVYAAKLIVELEKAYIDKCFEMGNVLVKDPRTAEMIILTPEHIKTFIEYRTIAKLNELGIQTTNLFEQNELSDIRFKQMGWFNVLSAGTEFQDFFASTPTAYSNGWDFTKLNDKDSWGIQ